jgi:hypothetical protein
MCPNLVSGWTLIKINGELCIQVINLLIFGFGRIIINTERLRVATKCKDLIKAIYRRNELLGLYLVNISHQVYEGIHRQKIHNI